MNSHQFNMRFAFMDKICKLQHSEEALKKILIRYFNNQNNYDTLNECNKKNVKKLCAFIKNDPLVEEDVSNVFNDFDYNDKQMEEFMLFFINL